MTNKDIEIKSPFKTVRLGQTPAATTDDKKGFEAPSVGTVAAVSRDVLVSAAAAAVLYRTFTAKTDVTE